MKKLDRHYVTRAERKLIRAREQQFPALSSAVKTLLDIHSLEARPVRDHRQRPYEWKVTKAGPNKGLRPWLDSVFRMNIDAPLSDWQERCNNPDTWNGMTFMGFNSGRWTSHDKYQGTLEQMQQQVARISGWRRGVHDEVIIDDKLNVDFSAAEARIAASLDQKTAHQSALTERLVRKKGAP